ncbi:hypothetical protein [Pseudonocardia humida]|uniref:Fe2OG dioxygenase domain-containing protein n=1 Tax=Pseudonocardia humida TaxID=2800819 RepID=A0ABT1A2T5_9PSEU|nr:hypothetical protein [Pseudonocardia humida]MCO1657326.1 hypothetical protein [Pseudonocardia humida]
MQNGYAVLRAEFPQTLTDALVADAQRHEFRLWSPGKGGAFALAALDEPGAPREAAAWLSRAAADHGFAGFTPNEVSYQRYTAGGNGIPPHRDQRYYAACIGIITLRGSATFAVHGSRDRDDVVDEWTTGPGEVILLRGWSPDPDSDPRPYHRIDPPTSGERLMFQARRNLAAPPPSPWAEHLTQEEAQQASRLVGATPVLRSATGGSGPAADDPPRR